MTGGPGREIKLRSGPEKTASWVRLGPGGTLEAEFYDYSESAEEHFGNDVAFLLELDPGARLRMEEILLQGCPRSGDREDTLLRAIEACFPDFFELKGWLRELGIPFRESFDSRA